MGLRRRRRMVRVHLETASEAGSIDGVLDGRVGGHYRVLSAAVVGGEGRSLSLDGPAVLIPAERVVFIQELAP